MNTKGLIVSCFSCLAIMTACEDDSSFQRLEADFKASVTNVKSGEVVVFSDLSLGNAATWSWEFEGGTPDTSILSGPSIVYSKPGTYAVTLRITNLEYQDEITRDAFISVGYNEVTADFEAGSTLIVEGEEIEFKDRSIGFVESWAWEFTSESGVKLTSTEENPKIVFAEAGVYDVRLSVSNAEYSGEKVISGYITVMDPADLNADFKANITGTYEGGSVTFSDQSLGLVTVRSWEFEGGTPAVSTEAQPTVTYTQAGRYKVKFVASNQLVSREVVKEGYIVVVPGTNLAAYFPFGGSLSDAGPNKLVPEVRGTVTTEGADRNGQVNDAALFNGSGGLLVPDHVAFNFGTSDYSVSCWVKTNHSNRMMIWQESGDKGSKDNQTWMRLGANTTTQLLGFATEDANGGSFLGLSEAEGGKMYDDVWHHVVCVRKELKTSVYVDGVKRKEVSSKNGVKEVSNSEPFKIGMQGGSSGYFNYLNGSLDDLVIYNKALTEAEIAQLFNL